MYVGPWQEYKLMKVIEQVKAENTRLKASQLVQHDQQQQQQQGGLLQSYATQRNGNGGGGPAGGLGLGGPTGGLGLSGPGYLQPTRKSSISNQHQQHHATQSVDGRSQGSRTTQQSTQSAPPLGLSQRPGGEHLYQSSKSFRNLVDPQTNRNNLSRQPVLSRNRRKEQQLQQQKDALGATAEDRIHRRTKLAMMYAEDNPGEQHQEGDLHSQSGGGGGGRPTQGRRAQPEDNHTTSGGGGPTARSDPTQRPLNQSLIKEMRSTYHQPTMSSSAQRQPIATMGGGGVPWDDGMHDVGGGQPRQMQPVHPQQQQMSSYRGGGGGSQQLQRPTSSRRMDLGAPIQPGHPGAVRAFVPPVDGRGKEMSQLHHTEPGAAHHPNPHHQEELRQGQQATNRLPEPLSTDLLASANGRMMQRQGYSPTAHVPQASTPRSPPTGTGYIGGSGGFTTTGNGTTNIPRPPVQQQYHHQPQPVVSEGSPVKRPLAHSTSNNRTSPAGFLENARYSPMPTSAGGYSNTGQTSTPNSAGGLRQSSGRLNGTGVSVDASQDVGSLLNWAANLQVPDF